jgi:hypothetical protein
MDLAREATREGRASSPQAAGKGRAQSFAETIRVISGLSAGPGRRADSGLPGTSASHEVKDNADRRERMELADIDEATLARLGSQIAAQMPQGQRPESAAWNRRIDFIIAAIAIVSFIFSLGINWSRLTANEERLSLVNTRVDRIEADIRSLSSDFGNQRADTKVMSEKLDTIKSDVSEIKGRLNR